MRRAQQSPNCPHLTNGLFSCITAHTFIWYANFFEMLVFSSSEVHQNGSVNFVGDMLKD